MHKVNQQPANLDLGWSIQIYSGQRRLLCVLDASHAWSLITGIGFGFLCALLTIHAPMNQAQSPSLGNQPVKSQDFDYSHWPG
ncbi:hypothetical protein [Synechococcus sp. PCC 6312]|uniref:hypothetical protein n=1 Tax=Synechococcus sp. (strain ATCC 27167 / PCC 6312) TaxID=195253 RepID=UPI00029EF975|nr:hypothetical protein [Synechococcus sp. PCC 6312]AFY62253.1 hypothetical protein Syn6312_3207 [Synechococcus sp. PCC 6312]